MNIKKISAIIVTSMLIMGCANASNENTTYGVPDNKWSVMSYEQRESAKEVYKLDQLRVEEQAKLDNLRAEKVKADAQRKLAHKDELNRIAHENNKILEQQKRVASITDKENLRQKQREQDLDNLKGPVQTDKPA